MWTGVSFFRSSNLYDATTFTFFAGRAVHRAYAEVVATSPFSEETGTTGVAGPSSTNRSFCVPREYAALPVSFDVPDSVSPAVAFTWLKSFPGGLVIVLTVAVGPGPLAQFCHVIAVMPFRKNDP